jgi:hypothetical protein
VEPAREEFDNLYNMKSQMDEYINPIIDGALSWRNIRSYTSYSEEGLEN